MSLTGGGLLDLVIAGQLENPPDADPVSVVLFALSEGVRVRRAASRLGRSLSQLVGLFETTRSLGVDLYLDQRGVDTTTPSGRALLGMAAVFAEFERSMLVERTKAGIERARARGRRIGRPPAGEDVEAAVRSLRSRGMGMDRIARELGIGKSVAQRVCLEVDHERREMSAGS